MFLQAGQTPIPGYRLTQPLGRGAFAEVWEAERSDNARFALKFLDCRQSAAAQVGAEIRMLRGLHALKHPNIIQLHEIHAWDRYVLLVMERADGNLEDLRLAYQRQTGGNIPPRHTLDLLDQAAWALDFIASARPVGSLASKGLQHCDVKPTNLLLIGNTLKVADFGLCTGTGWKTHTSGWRGTPPFAAPELWSGSPAPGTDQFALAVTFCTLVLGVRALVQGEHHSSPPGEIPIDLTKLRTSEYPVIARALHKFPTGRYPSCREFMQDLRKACNAPRPNSRIYPRGVQGSLRESEIRVQLSTNTM